MTMAPTLASKSDNWVASCYKLTALYLNPFSMLQMRVSSWSSSSSLLSMVCLKFSYSSTRSSSTSKSSWITPLSQIGLPELARCTALLDRFSLLTLYSSRQLEPLLGDQVDLFWAGRRHEDKIWALGSSCSIDSFDDCESSSSYLGLSSWSQL